MKIAVIEDHDALRQELRALLERYGYETCAPEGFVDVVGFLREAAPHLVLLDINLPGVDGYTLCRQLRRESRLPIIIVTSRDSELDELMSMNLGADDFVSKPYNSQILLARIAAVLTRSYPENAPARLSHRGVTLDLTSARVSYQGNYQELTKNELKILHLLMQHPGEVCTRDAIIEALWQSDAFVDDNTLTVNVNRLRKKLEALGAADYIVTRRGLGYSI